MEREVRIVVTSDWFSEKMGYAENCLPKALASLGHDVHLVTSNTVPYFNSPSYRDVYERFLGPGVVACGTSQVDGFHVHRLPYALHRGHVMLRGLAKTLRVLAPEV